MRETEITVQVFNNNDDIDKILKSKGFEITETFQLDDYYFSTLKNVKSVDFKQLIDKSILVRGITRNGQKKVELMYKKKEYDDEGVVIGEEKTKAHLDNFENTLKILSLSGLNNYMHIQNDSAIYENDEMKICLQMVDGLGTFIEYEEDEAVYGLTDEEKIKIMAEKLKGLGLKLGEDFSCKKVDMMLKSKYGEKEMTE